MTTSRLKSESSLICCLLIKIVTPHFFPFHPALSPIPSAPHTSYLSLLIDPSSPILLPFPNSLSPIFCHFCWLIGSVHVGPNDSRIDSLSTGPFARPFACTAHSFICSTLLASLARSAALTRLLARSFCSLLNSWERGFFYEMTRQFHSLSTHCAVRLRRRA